MDSNKWGKFAGISPETSPPPFAWGKRGAKHFPPPLLSSQLEKSQSHLESLEKWKDVLYTTLCDCACLRCLHFGSCQAMHAYPLLAFWFMSSHVCLPSASIFFCLAMHAYTMHCLHFFSSYLSMQAFHCLNFGPCLALHAYHCLHFGSYLLMHAHLCLHLCTLLEKQSKFPRYNI